MRRLLKASTEISFVALALMVTPLVGQALVVEGGTVHPLSGEPFVGRVVVAEGLIQAAGPDVEIPAGATTVDATGLHVYPGLFDAMSQVGLVEVNAVSATDDQAEMGTYNPHLRAATAFHPASAVIGVTRANGITHTMVAPKVDDGVIAGQGAVLHLAGWTVEEMAVDAAAAMIVAWPEVETRSFDFSTFSFRETPFNEAEEKAEKQQNELRDWLDAARHYAQATGSGSDRVERDLKLEALARILEGGQTVVVQADAKRDIEAAVAFAEEQGLKMVLAGGREAWKVKDLLAEKEIPVILGLTQSLPREEDDPYDTPFRSAGKLVEAGVRIAFSSGAGGGFGPGGPHVARTTPYEAGMAAAYGLSEEEALKAMTLYPAQIFGVDDRLGTIEAGKVANLIVTDGNPLAITTQILHLVINGQKVSTDNRHDQLYEHHRAR